MERRFVKGEGNTPEGALGSFHKYYHQRAYPSTSPSAGLRDRPSARSYTVSGKLYPNGEFSYGYVRRVRKQLLDERIDTYENECALKFRAYWDAHKGIVREYYREGDGGMERGYSILGLSKVLNSHKPTFNDAGRKRAVGSGISGLGRKMIRNGGYLMENTSIPAGFYTFTLPRLAQEDYVSVFDDWANVIRSLIQWMGRKLDDAGLPRYLFWVTEYQVNRSNDVGCPIPHLHLCCPCYYPGTTKFIFEADELRVAWSRAILPRCRKSVRNVNFASSVDCQVCKKDPSRYMSKYMTKGSHAEDAFSPQVREIESTRGFRFWGISYHLRKDIRENTVAIGDSLATLIEGLYYGVSNEQGLKATGLRIHTYTDAFGLERKCGVSGRLNYRLTGNLQFDIVPD